MNNSQKTQINTCLSIVITSAGGTSVLYGKSSIKYSENSANIKFILYWQDSKSYLSVRLFSEIEEKWVFFHSKLLIDLLSSWDLCWRSKIEGQASYCLFQYKQQSVKWYWPLRPEQLPFDSLNLRLLSSQIGKKRGLKLCPFSRD